MKKLPASSKFTLLAFCFFNRPGAAESLGTYNTYISEQREKYPYQYFVRRHRAPPDVRAWARKGNKNAICIDPKLARSIVPESDVIDYFCLHSHLWSQSKVSIFEPLIVPSNQRFVYGYLGLACSGFSDWVCLCCEQFTRRPVLILNWQIEQTRRAGCIVFNKRMGIWDIVRFTRRSIE